MKNINKLSSSIWQKANKYLNMHSLIVDYNSEIIFEEYNYPYNKNKMHRMFSITKSFTSIAIGYLISDNKLSLHDKIIDFYPEYREEADEYIKNMTIEDMLTMRTTHDRTTYDLSKNPSNSDTCYVETFFKTKSTHRSGMLFNYDTSSTHTLANLVCKLSGMSVLDYLREKKFKEIGFSDDAYIIKDPYKDEFGGTGLMCYPMDIARAGRFILDELNNDKAYLHDYLKKATSFQTSNYQTGQTLEEMIGYGYQFWIVRNGFAMYGMGGQYCLIYPEQNLIITTTADLQSLKGGVQILLNIINDALEEYMNFETPIKESFDFANYNFEKGSSLYSNCDKKYKVISDKSMNQYADSFKEFHLKLSDSEKRLKIVLSDNEYDIPFEYGKDISSKFGKEMLPICAKAVFTAKDVLYLQISFVGEDVGQIHISMHIDEDVLTIQMKKAVEGKYAHFSGFLEAKAF